MPSEISFPSIFETVLPNIYIRNVSLLHSNMVDSRTASHSDLDIEQNLETTEFGTRKFKNKLIDFSQVAPEEDYLMVQVNMTIKDVLRENGKLYWIDNDKILDSLKIRVLLSRDKKATEIFSNRGLLEKNIQIAKKRGSIREQIISVKKVIHRGQFSAQVERLNDRDIHSMSYSVSFKLHKLRPDHIAIFASTFVDLNELALKKTKFVQATNSILQGNIVAQIVLDDGEIRRKSKVYLLPSGKIYAGPVHTKDGITMAGAFHTQNTHPALREKNIENTVITDYRIINRAKKLKPQLYPYRLGNQKLKQNKHAQQPRKNLKPAYISEPEYANTRNNELHMIFHMNFHKYIKENSQFGAILQFMDPSARRRAMELSNISSFRIYRNRVTKGIHGEDSKFSDHDDHTELIVISSERSDGKIQTKRYERSRNPELTESEKITIGSVREIDLGFPARQGIRTFSVSDLGMAKKTDGGYTYTLEVNIVDGVQKFVEEERDRLTTARTFMTEYYNSANKRGNIDPGTGAFTQKYKKSIRDSYDIVAPSNTIGDSRRQRRQVARRSIAELPWNIAVATYIDIFANVTKIDNKAAGELAKILYIFTNPDTGSIDGINLVLRLIEKLEEELSLKLGSRSASVLELDYKSYTAAYNSRLPKDSLRYEKTFKKVHDSNIQKFVGYEFLGPEPDRGEPGLRVVTTSQYKDRLSREHEKYFGGTTKEGNLGLEPAYYTYLTPAAVEIGKFFKLSLIDRGPSVWNPLQYSVFLASRLAINPKVSADPEETRANTSGVQGYDLLPPIDFGAGFIENSPQDSKESYTISAANATPLSSMGISILSPSSFDKEETASLSIDGEDEESDGIGPKDLFGENTKFVTDPISILAPEDGDLTQSEKIDLSETGNIFVDAVISSDTGAMGPNKRPTIRKYNLKNKNNILESRFSNKENAAEKKRIFLNRVPNQIKSIFLSDDSAAAVNWFELARETGADLMQSPKYSGLLYLNFRHINRIEVLTGFERDRQGELQISLPTYRPLTRNLFDLAEKSGRILACRMVSYKNRLLHIKKSKKMMLPEYDSVFLMVPANLNQVNTTEDLEQVVSPPEEDDTESLFLSRVTEFTRLHESGRTALRQEVKRLTERNDVPVEFQATLKVLQPNTVSRVGTRFGERPERLGRRQRGPNFNVITQRPIGGY